VPVPTGFTGSTIDRGDNLRLDPARMLELRQSPDARLMRLSGADPILDSEGRLTWTSPAAANADEIIFLGLDQDVPLFAPLNRLDQSGQRAWSVYRLLDMMAKDEVALWGAARSLIAWHGRHGFCANCGAPTAVFRAGWGRKCASCAAEHFPRVDPVVIMLAEHDGQVLLARQPQFPAGRYSALAGFVEPGESIEEAVAREFKEEAGVAVSEVRYVASQPWPFPGSLMIACFASAKSGALTIDRTELEDAMWASRTDVIAALAGDPAAPFQAPPPLAIARTLLECWIGDV
jgi:NAD+ diphosphatase